MAPKGIRVNAIAPGGVATENQAKANPDFDPVSFGKRLPAGFIAEPKDIGGVAVFLASDAAPYIIGQTMLVDGGLTAMMATAPDFRERQAARYGADYAPGLVSITDHGHLLSFHMLGCSFR